MTKTTQIKPTLATETTVIPPVKTSNTTASVVLDNSVTHLRPYPKADHLHNLFHRNGMLAIAQGACWLVLAGNALLEEKKKVGHGGWDQWVAENCEFTLRTAQKYIALAIGVKNKALQHNIKDTSELIPLLRTPVDELSPKNQEHLLYLVHKLTDGQTVQQLYMDFGITKAPQGSGAKGGHHPALGNGEAGLPDPNSMEEKAKLMIIPTYNKLVEEFYYKTPNNLPQWSYLPRKELESIDATLMDMRNEIKAVLQGK